MAGKNLPKILDQSKAFCFRHYEVSDEQIDRNALGNLNRLLAIARHKYFVAFLLQDSRKEVEKKRFVVDNQKFCRHQCYTKSVINSDCIFDASLELGHH